MSVDVELSCPRVEGRLSYLVAGEFLDLASRSRKLHVGQTAFQLWDDLQCWHCCFERFVEHISSEVRMQRYWYNAFAAAV